QDLRSPAEVQHHVELIDKKRRAAQQIQIRHRLRYRAHGFEPLPDAERRHSRHLRRVDDDALDVGADGPEPGEMLVDQARYAHEGRLTRDDHIDARLGIYGRARGLGISGHRFVYLENMTLTQNPWRSLRTRAVANAGKIYEDGRVKRT